MKKLWVGIGILAALLAIAIGGAIVLGHVHGELADRLEQAAEEAPTDWQGASALAQSVQEDWSRHRHWIAALVDHEPLEEINGLFDQLDLCKREKNPEKFAAVCLQIATICTALEESHMPFWWNLL